MPRPGCRFPANGFSKVLPIAQEHSAIRKIEAHQFESVPDPHAKRCGQAKHSMERLFGHSAPGSSFYLDPVQVIAAKQRDFLMEFLLSSLFPFAHTSAHRPHLIPDFSSWMA